MSRSPGASLPTYHVITSRTRLLGPTDPNCEIGESTTVEPFSELENHISKGVEIIPLLLPWMEYHNKVINYLIHFTNLLKDRSPQYILLMMIEL